MKVRLVELKALSCRVGSSMFACLFEYRKVDQMRDQLSGNRRIY